MKLLVSRLQKLLNDLNDLKECSSSLACAVNRIDPIPSSLKEASGPSAPIREWGELSIVEKLDRLGELSATVARECNMTRDRLNKLV